MQSRVYLAFPGVGAAPGHTIGQSVAMPSARDLVTFSDAEEPNPWVRGAPSGDTAAIVPADPAWAARSTSQAADIRAVLGARALTIEHVGSTSVRGLAAKNVIDVDVSVADPADEDAYVLLLEPLGYWLCVREPTWFGHRMLRLDDPRVNLHVWGPDSPEAVRHRLFRDWLTAQDEDRALYEAAKRAAVGPGTTMVARAGSTAVSA